MRFISIDVETTGIDADKCQILSIGAVIDDTIAPLTLKDVPQYYKRVSHDEYKGEIYALNLNKDLLTEILENKDGLNIHVDNLKADFQSWVNKYFDGSEKITIAGKNFANFDKKFLDKLGVLDGLNVSYQFLDVGSLYWEPKTDAKLPSLQECLDRAEIKTEVTHNALEDAMDVVKVIRHNIKVKDDSNGNFKKN